MSDINAYQGNPDLGYGTSGPGGGLYGTYDGNLTLNAWDKFAVYNYSRNRDLWVEANKKKDELAAEAGRLLPFKYGDMMDSDKDQINKAIQDYTSSFTKNPNAVRLEFDSQGKIINAPEHSDLLNKRDQINQMITRANVRKTQVTALESQIAQITDPKKREKALEWMKTEQAKPIGEDILLFPDYQLFNPTDYFKKITPSINFDELQRNPNDIVKTKTTTTNFSRGLSTFNLDYTMNNNGVRKEFDDTLGSFNDIIEQSRGEDGKVDMNKLARHPQGQSIIDMMNASNKFLDFYNTKVDQKVIPLERIDKIDLNDGLTISELGKLFISSQIGFETDKSITSTNDATEAGKLAIERGKLNVDQGELRLKMKAYEEGNDKEASGGELGNQAWWNLGKLAAPEGVEIQGTVYQNAFADNTSKTISTKETDEDGNVQTIKQNVKRTPTRMFVYADKNGDPNKFSVVGVYEDENGKQYTKKFTASEAYAQMSYVSGDDKKADVLSKMNTAYRLRKIGSRNIDWTKLDNYYSVQEKKNPVQGKPTDKPIALPESGDISMLVNGQVYDVKGKLYIWNGKNLVPKK